MTLDHAHFENVFFFTLTTVDCDYASPRIPQPLPVSNIDELATTLPAPNISCYLYYLLVEFYFLWHVEPHDLLAAEAGLDIRQSHDHEAVEVFG